MKERNVLFEIEKYETYINEVLKSDLNKICSQLDEVNTDIAEYQSLQKTINLLQEFKDKNQVYKTMMDIGCNFFMETRVNDLSHILLDIGQGCYLEFTLVEALKFLENKLKFLTNRQDSLHEKSAKIKAHIKLMLLYVNQLNDSHKPT
ncbi:protein UXT [Planococcus citri]|uniref:protein UXT n=1 Tax=Planococcus citri TaxID=170843 RepID=UPI0031F742F5